MRKIRSIISQRVRLNRTQKFLSEISLDDIPKGSYCYNIKEIVHPSDKKFKKKKRIPVIKIESCPYHKMISKKPEQICGYCRLLKAGDWQIGGTFLLWDKVKECGENLNDEEEKE